MITENELRQRADEGSPEAQYDLGWRYSAGHGVPKNDVEALKWLRKAADQGHPKSQNILGLMYAVGHGVPQDDVEAAKWFRKAADQGLAQAQHSLGVMYYFGNGVPQDEVEAAKWFRKAADQGFAQAQNDLGAMYGKWRGDTPRLCRSPHVVESRRSTGQRGSTRETRYTYQNVDSFSGCRCPAQSTQKNGRDSR